MPKKQQSAGPPPKEAIEYFRSKGWKVGFDFQDVWNQEHAFAFTAAKAMTVDVLETLRGAVDQALAEGRTFRDFAKDLQPELEKLGWWGKAEMPDPKTGELKDVQLGSPRRLKVIYQTNLRTARAAGKWERIQRTKKLLPYLRYSLGPSEKHRPEHVAWEGLELLADDPWWDTHMPPNGWGCKCWVQQLTKADVDSTGGPDEAPADEMQEWTNPRTGETEQLPKGISPGFNFNPGKAREEKQLDQFKEKLNGVSANAADAVHRAWLQPEIFGQWRQDPKGNIPVAVMDDDTLKLMGSQQRTVYLSDWTMKKQDRKHPQRSDGKPTKSKGHPDLENWEYALLPDVLLDGQIIQQSEQKVVFSRHLNRLYQAVVKTTESGTENYVDSFQRAKEADIGRQLRKAGAKEIRKEKEAEAR
jgi:hypothetical protein